MPGSSPSEVIGWIPIRKNGKPYRTQRSHYLNGKISNNPIKVYLTEAKAASYSPDGLAKQAWA